MTDVANKSTKSKEDADREFLDRQSRTIGTYGLETMLKLVGIKVLIAGCRGIGAEAAKNLSLAGIHTISLYDPVTPTVQDLGLNFALNDTNYKTPGATRASLTAKLLSELNPNTRIKVVTEKFEDAIPHHDVVIVNSDNGSSFSEETLFTWNNLCRAETPKKTISFILCYQQGAIGSIFVDHGPQFVTKDADGRTALQKAITEVNEKVDKKGNKYSRVRYMTPEGMQPGALRDYTELKFSDVKGLKKADGSSINGLTMSGVAGIDDPKQTCRIYPSFEEQGFSAYEGGGFLLEQKEQTTRDFRPLKECLTHPTPVLITNSMMDGTAENNVHLFLSAVLKYGNENKGSGPAFRDANAAAKILDLAKKVNEAGKPEGDAAAAPAATAEEEPEDKLNEMPSIPKVDNVAKPFTVDNIDEDFLKQAALNAGVQFQPFCALVGAIAAQEVVKVTGKYTPIHQFLHFHSHEVLQTDLKEEDMKPIVGGAGATRYDDIKGLVGAKLFEKMQNAKVFMVGCGALGCEDFKNFALCGLATGPNGMLTVTDNDRIEVSNLSRQFLFREENVGQPKSVAASNRAKIMNTELKVDAKQEFVGPTTEHIFDEKFWSGLDIVVNALDNMTARLYVDSQCVLHEKLLKDAGTTGTAGNVDIIVPHKTTSYSDGGAADETGGIPMCTLRNFPYIYDHCIEWARAQFDDLFIAPLLLTQQLREDPDTFCDKLRREVEGQDSLGAQRSMLEKNTAALKGVLKTVEVLAANPTIETCVQLAWEVYHTQFRDRIVNLITDFPRDAKKKGGEAFWSNQRRFPTALDSNSRKDVVDVYDYLISATNLYATMFGLHPVKHQPKDNESKNRWMSQYRNTVWLEGVLSKLPVPEFKRAAVDGLDEESAGASKAAKEEVDDSQLKAEFDAMLKEAASKADKIHAKAAPLEFEKDDDDNFHIDFIAAASNLRAMNYDIPTSDRFKVKMVAGRIIPAIATTTAAACGLSLIEIIKVYAGCEPYQLRNGNFDLGTNTYIMFDRDPPNKIKTFVRKTYDPKSHYTEEVKVVAWPEGHTKYDKLRFKVNDTMTVGDFAALVEARTKDTANGGCEDGYTVSALGVGKAMVWNGMPAHSNTKKALKQVISDYYVESQPKLYKDSASFWAGKNMFCHLVVSLDTEDMDEVHPATIILDLE